MHALIPAKLLLGAGLSGALYRWGSAGHDQGNPIPALWRSQRYAAAGTGGELILRGAAFTARYSGACSVKLTPIMDEVRYDDAAITLDLPAPTTATWKAYRALLAFNQAYVVDGFNWGTLGIRGGWCQLELTLESVVGNDVDGNAGTFCPDGLELDVEPVGVTAVTVASPE